MTKNEIEERMLFYSPILTISNENKGVRIDAELDIFNNHIEYQIIDEDLKNIIYFSTYDICEAIDKYRELKEKK